MAERRTEGRRPLLLAPRSRRPRPDFIRSSPAQRNDLMLPAIDASPAVRSRPTGVESYTRSIIQALAAQPRGHRIRCYANTTDRPAWLPASVEWRGIPFPRLWTH